MPPWLPEVTGEVDFRLKGSKEGGKLAHSVDAVSDG